MTASTSSAPSGGAFWRLLGSSAAVNLGDGLMTVALVWLASSLTRDPLVLSIIAFAGRLPWLVFSLPAGVITDRVDRRLIVASMDVVRCATLACLTALVLAVAHELPTPAQLAAGAPAPSSAPLVIAALVTVALILGFCEVLRDNAAQTLLPSIVPKKDLEKANGHLWSAELICNSFVGPPLAGVLLGVSIGLPFGLYTVLLAAGAVLVFTIPRARTITPPQEPVGSETPTQIARNSVEDVVEEGDAGSAETVRPASRQSMWTAVREGFTWLWSHSLLRTLAILLGVMNFSNGMTSTILVLYVQDALGIFDGLWFGVVTTGVAVGAVVTSLLASRITSRFPPGALLKTAVLITSLMALIQGLVANSVVFWLTEVISGVALIVWNVITVSLRQRIIPDAMLGRVNSVYRFFGWGAISLGTVAGGTLAALLGTVVSHEWALRGVFLAEGVCGALCFVAVLAFVSTRRIREAEAEAAAGSAQ